MLMEVREYDADDVASVEADRQILNAAYRTDCPWLPELTHYRRQMSIRYGWDQSPERHLLACVDGAPVAVAEVELGEWDNRDLAWVYLIVHPDHRRAGIGSAFLAEISAMARQDGRLKIGGAWWQTPATEGFARHHGFELGSQEIYRRVTLADLPSRFADAAYAEASPHARDYELVRIEGYTPVAMLPALADVTASINDAPIDDLDIEDEVFPVERIQNYENAALESGHRLYRVVARHRGTGELGGHTVVAVDTERPHLAHQHDTSVSRDHRGHRLGLLLKADLMRWLAEVEPQVVSIDTWNAESNAHMITVNERLGYQALGRELAFQRRL
jgi:GNAT superfamily N-acetyltransferase